MLRSPLTFKILFITAFMFSLSAFAIEVRRGENVDVTGQFNESLFLVGQRVHSDVQSTDDLFMAGRNVMQIGGSADNLFAAGGDVELQHPKARLGIAAGGNITLVQSDMKDLILAGGRIHVSQSHIRDDAILAGGEIDIADDSVIDDSVTITGGQIRFAGTAGGDVEISGNDVELSGTFSKNVRVQAEHLRVAPNTRIAGNFLHGVTNLEMSPTATVQGRNEALTPEMTGTAQRTTKTWAVFAGLLFVIGMLSAPALVASVFPNFVQESSHRIHRSLWESIGIGTVIFILAPILIVFLFTTVIGVPVALFCIPFFFVAGSMAWSIAVFSTGNLLRDSYRRARKYQMPQSLTRKEIFLWTFFGALALFIVLIIPVVGFILCLILFLAGLGSIYLQMRGGPQKESAVRSGLEKPTGFIPAGTPV